MRGDQLHQRTPIKLQLAWSELPEIHPKPPAVDELATAWPLNRWVPLREIFLSLGLEYEGPVPLLPPLGAEDTLAQESVQVAAEIDDVAAGDECETVDANHCSSDDMSIVAP